MRLADFLPSPSSSWCAPDVSSLPAWPEHGRVAIDCETCDPKLEELGIGVRRGGYVVGVSFAIDGGPAHYLPIRHAGGGNLPLEHVRTYLRDQAEAFCGELVGANMGYDLEYLAVGEGVEFSSCRFRDVQVIEPLLDELQLSYSLDAILRRYGLSGKDEDLLRAAAASRGLDPKKDLWRLPASMVGAYAEGDVSRPLDLLPRQLAKINDQGLEQVFERECRLLPVLVKMRRRGVRVDLDRLSQVEVWARAKEEAACAEFARLTGVRMGVDDCDKKSFLLPVVKSFGVALPRTEPSARFPQGQESVTTDLLYSLKQPWSEAIVVAKKFNKLRRTFAESVREHLVGDRIHCTLRQSRVEREGSDDEQGARFGRLSCVDPNLQQQPARYGEIGPVWRSIYVPDEGGTWACADISQQEPRWAVHYASAMRCRGADEALRRYVENPATDFYQMLVDMTGVSRDDSKTLTLGLLYGMGGGKLCKKLGLPYREVTGRAGKKMLVAGEEGVALMAKFDQSAGFLREIARLASAKAEQRGWLATAGGRRCRFPRRGRSYDWTHKALNRIVQGSSGDQVKEAMVLADSAGYQLQLQVHDEVDLTCDGDPTRLRGLVEALKTALPCRVPHKVDLELGPNWGNLKKVSAG